MMHKPVLKLCFALLTFFQFAFYSEAQKYSFENYMPVNGLASSTINQIFQDSKGYIWFACQGGGVSRFNGKEFKNFTHANGLCSNDVTCITEDKSGQMWFGTVDGVSQFTGTGFKTYHKSNGLTGGVVYGIYCDSANRIWIATHDGGIRIFNGVGFDSLTVKNNLSSNEVYNIIQDRQGNYWFGLSNGITKYSHGKLTNYASSKIMQGKTFFSSLVDATGNIWFTSTSGDVVVIHPHDSIEKIELPPLLNKDFIGSIAQDKKGNIWMATDHGLLKYDHHQFKLFGEADGLSVNSAQAVMADYEDNIWTGTLSGGANLLSSEAFVQYTDKDGLGSKNITAICKDPAGPFHYIGTGSGLYLFNPKATPPFQHIDKIKSLEKMNISSLAVDKKGALWVTAQEGVFVIVKQGHVFQLKKEYHTIAGHKLVSASKVLHDAKGNTWIASYGSGLFCISAHQETCYNTQSKFVSDVIITVFEDSKSNIWAGTQDAGVVKYNGKNFEPVALQPGLHDKAVWAIAEDDNGNMFFGTGESGLCRWDGKQIKRFTAQEGLLADYIPVLLWDRFDKCLWLAGDKGIQKITFTGNDTLSTIHNYAKQDGFNATSVNQNGIWMDDEGLLWLGTVNGLWHFNRTLDFIKNTPPKIQLTGVRLFYQKVDWKAWTDTVNSQTNLPVNPALPYNKNHLTFDIQALTTSDVKYIFKLEGQDADWSVPTKNTEITYANIAPGQNYLFKARAINSKGILGAEIVSFPFSVNPPWWSTWWFRTLLTVVILSGLAFFITTREKILKEQNTKLEGIVEQRTQEIERQKNVVENTLAEKEVLLKEIHHRVKNNLQTISSLLMLQGMELKDEEAKKAITESQNRVRSISLLHQKLYQTDGLEKIEFSAFVTDLVAQVNTVYKMQASQVTITTDIAETYLLMDTAIPLGLILNELLTNSFKYAFKGNPAGEIKMKLSIADTMEVKNELPVNAKKIKFNYWDNGKEWNAQQDFETGQTLGIKLVKILSRQIGAELEISVKDGTAFSFIFNTPV